MLGKTHLAVGTAAALAVLHPHTPFALAGGLAAASVGSLISDIDISTSESHQESDKVILLSCAAVGLAALAEKCFHLGLTRRILAESSLFRVLLAVTVFLLVCAVGRVQPHRGFMHSIAAGFIMASCTSAFLPLLPPYFAVGFVSHLAIDLLNHKGEQLLFPLRHRFCFGVCSSKGHVNRMLFSWGSAISSILFLICFLRCL